MQHNAHTPPNWVITGRLKEVVRFSNRIFSSKLTEYTILSNRNLGVFCLAKGKEEDEEALAAGYTSYSIILKRLYRNSLKKLFQAL